MVGQSQNGRFEQLNSGRIDSRPVTARPRKLRLGLAGLVVAALATVVSAVAPTAHAQSRADDAYRPPQADGYRGQADYDGRGPATAGTYGAGQDQGRYGNDRGTDAPPRGGQGGYGAPYTPGPAADDRAPPPPPQYSDTNPNRGYYEQGEIVEKGRGFFGSVSQGLASAIEHTYRKAGRPNGYILGEDAGGAFFAGLRYGEGMLYTKDAGDHKVFWQGPSLGYDIGGEGSKVMILAYNMSSPDDIFYRYGGVEGSAYLVGGVSVQFQKSRNVTLAVIRSGVGLRLGANVGYSKYSRRPTWNPF